MSLITLHTAALSILSVHIMIYNVHDDLDRIITLHLSVVTSPSATFHHRKHIEDPYCFEIGKGCNVDINQAIFNYCKAAAADNAQSQHRLGS
jgi:hypothetical protein